jgi:hypothetical protein
MGDASLMALLAWMLGDLPHKAIRGEEAPGLKYLP